MENTFNLFRLNCMMDDNKSKNYNSIIVSLIFELLYENGNSDVPRLKCYEYLVSSLNIKIDKELFISLIESNPNFVTTSGENDVFLKLTKEKFQDIDSKVHNHSIEFYIEEFLTKNRRNKELKTSLMDLLNKSIYENVNSFTINNIKSILPQSLKEKFKKEEIDTFNDFLDEDDHQKNIALFNVFLKAVEFAIITSGKGVKQFTKDIFIGKEYCLDSNVIFRLLGVGGEERRESLVKLIEACIHQGIKFKYCIETYKEVVRKIDSIIVEINHGIENNSLQILEDIIKNADFEFNNGFVVHYALCKLAGRVKSPEQYQVMLLADFKTLRESYHIDSIDGSFKIDKVEHWQNKLFEKKKEINFYSHYTKSAAKVDAINILLVRKLRGSNDYNYSDIVSFYLTTDRTLNSIMANENKEKIAETILPSQLFILHNALSDDEDERDYKSFNKFLKRRTTEFNQTGKAVLHYIDELRNITTNPESIRNIIKAYSDQKYETSLLSVDSEPQFKSIREFAETQMDIQLKGFKDNSDMFQLSKKTAIDDFEQQMKDSKKTVKTLDIFFSVIIIPISILVIKSITNDLKAIVIGTLLIEGFKFIISTKTKVLPNLTRYIFLYKIRNTNFYKLYNMQDKDYYEQAEIIANGDLKIYK